MFSALNVAHAGGVTNMPTFPSLVICNISSESILFVILRELEFAPSLI